MIYVRRKPLEADVFQDAMAEALSGDLDRVGCAVTFTGIVKRKMHGKTVASLHLGYDAEGLEERLEAIGREAEERYGLHSVVIYHNLDDLEPGSLVTHIVVAAERRAEAFEAARTIIERIKREVHLGAFEVYDAGG
jgi:molybdopterin synthase catalytic subunit